MDSNQKPSLKLDELLEKARARGLASAAESAAGHATPASEDKKAGGALAPDKHPQKDFFIADVVDAAMKDDLASMEHPLFALKAGDMRVRNYERNGYKVTIKPGHGGCATIHDKDIWIYCVSQMIEALNRGREDVSRTVRFTAHDFLVTTNRDVSGRSYERMTEALARLRGTSIETNIETDGQRERRGFGLVEAWRVVEKTSGGRMVAVEVTFPDWLYRSIVSRNVLTLSPDYFRIRKPIDRRIYEIARKHCGSQKQWQCTLKTLYEKSGSTDAIRNFRGAIHALVNSDELPEYQVLLDDADMVTFVRRK
jgi:plasmid replication initiation protein